MPTATITAGDEYVDVEHELGYAPDAEDIEINPLDDLKGNTWWLSDISDTTFRINIFSADLVDHSFSYTFPTVGIGITGAKYCTVALAKEFARFISYKDVGFANDTAYETHIEELAIMASRAIDRFCNRPDEFFGGGADLTEYQDGKEQRDADMYPLGDRADSHDLMRRTFYLEHFPIIDITSVHKNSAAVGESENWQEITKYGYDSTTGKMVFGSGSAPPAGFNRVRIIYSAGYASVPQDIIWACASLVANELLLRAKAYMSGAFKYERPSAVFEFAAGDIFTDEIKRRLEYYRKKRVIF